MSKEGYSYDSPYRRLMAGSPLATFVPLVEERKRRERYRQAFTRIGVATAGFAAAFDPEAFSESAEKVARAPTTTRRAPRRAHDSITPAAPGTRLGPPAA